MAFLLENMELLLSAAGLVLILAVPRLFFPQPARYFEAMAATATAVGLLHGLIFWGVRRRQRQVRRGTIAEIQRMCQDIIRNKLAVIVAAHDESFTEGFRRSQTERVKRSAEAIEALVMDLSEESLVAWHKRYGPGPLKERVEG